MKILIDIPAEEYRWIKQSDNTAAAALCSKECMMNAIKRGLVVSRVECPTNSDIVRALFPNENFHTQGTHPVFISSKNTTIHKEAWDAPFTIEETSNGISNRSDDRNTN